MNRRDFLGLFAKTSAAGAAAATGLIALPETHKPIELLEQKEIITDLDNPVIIHRIISFEYVRDENITFTPLIGSSDFYQSPGRIESNVLAKAYLESEDGVTIPWHGDATSTIYPHRNNPLQVIFDTAELRNKIFLVTKYEISGSVGKDLVADFHGIQVNSFGAFI